MLRQDVRPIHSPLRADDWSRTSFYFWLQLLVPWRLQSWWRWRISQRGWVLQLRWSGARIWDAGKAGLRQCVVGIPLLSIRLRLNWKWQKLLHGRLRQKLGHSSNGNKWNFQTDCRKSRPRCEIWSSAEHAGNLQRKSLRFTCRLQKSRIFKSARKQRPNLRARAEQTPSRLLQGDWEENGRRIHVKKHWRDSHELDFEQSPYNHYNWIQAGQARVAQKAREAECNQPGWLGRLRESWLNRGYRPKVEGRVCN